MASVSLNQALESLQNHCAQSQLLLELLGVDNFVNAQRKLNTLLNDLETTKQQRDAIVEALEVDNWNNAVQRARSIMRKNGDDG